MWPLTFAGSSRGQTRGEEQWEELKGRSKQRGNIWNCEREEPNVIYFTPIQVIKGWMTPFSGSILHGYSMRALFSWSEIFTVTVCRLSRLRLLQAPSVCSLTVGKSSYPESPACCCETITGQCLNYRSSYCEFHIDLSTNSRAPQSFQDRRVSRNDAFIWPITDIWALNKKHLSNPPAKRKVSIEVSVRPQGRGSDLILNFRRANNEGKRRGWLLTDRKNK